MSENYHQLDHFSTSDSIGWSLKSLFTSICADLRNVPDYNTKKFDHS